MISKINIKIEFKDKYLEGTVEEFRKLKDDLNELFGTNPKQEFCPGNPYKLDRWVTDPFNPHKWEVTCDDTAEYPDGPYLD